MLIILNRIYRILIIFILFSAESAIAATSHEIFFRRLGMHDGLSEISVNCVFKDSKGFLWAGTTLGLNRYDGYRFKKFYYCSCGVNGGVSSCLPDNNVLDIIEDAEHHLWIRTTIGYCIFDPLTETFNSDITSWLREHGMKGVVQNLNKNWNKEKQTVEYDTYLEFEKFFASQNNVGRYIIDEQGNNIEDILNICKKNAISINDYLVAKMIKQENINKVIIAADIRNRMLNYQQG